MLLQNNIWRNSLQSKERDGELSEKEDIATAWSISCFKTKEQLALDIVYVLIVGKMMCSYCILT